MQFLHVSCIIWGMFPLTDNIPRRTIPFVNYMIIAVTAYVFYLQFTAADFGGFVVTYAFIPADFSFRDPYSYRYVFYSMFLHGGLFHLISNMWFLRVFGDNVEDAFGHVKYLLFYLAGGTVAVFSQYFVMTDATVPMIGASGAVSAVSGAYFVYFRQARVHTLVTLIVIWTVIKLPASFVLGYWFLTQVLSGLGSFASPQDLDPGGVAFFAHIGGFIFGYLVAIIRSSKDTQNL